MKVVGIIAEYNPYHNGHAYHFSQSIAKTGADFSVCVMSGDFTQRGEPAMMNKWTRARMAVENGVDLVFELPYAFACNNAEYFAMGAVDILNRIGCVTHLSFGSESGELSLLLDAASLLAEESRELSESIKQFIDRGLSYPKARCEAVKKCGGHDAASVLNSANNILAVEYLKQIKVTGSNIVPVTVKRYGTGYLEKGFCENIGSATAIRDKMTETQELEGIRSFIPEETYRVLKTFYRNVHVKFNDFYSLLIYKILTCSSEQLSSILSATEGLENKMKKAIPKARDVESLIKSIKSKRYTETRIQRLLSHTLVGLEKEPFREILRERINYGRVLAFNQKGADLLKMIKKNDWNTIPVLTNINKELTVDEKEWKLLKYDILAADIYDLVTDGEIYNNSDYVRKPFKGF